MSDIQEEQKRLYKIAEENDKKILEKELEELRDIFNYEKDLRIKSEKEINRLNNIIDELTEEYINYMTKQDFAKKCNISRPYLDKLLKKMNRKKIYEFCKIRNKLKGDNK